MPEQYGRPRDSIRLEKRCGQGCVLAAFERETTPAQQGAETIVSPAPKRGRRVASRPLTGWKRSIRLAGIGSRVPQRQAMADHRSGACRVFARRPEDRGSFLFFRPTGPYHAIDRAPRRCTSTPSPPTRAPRRPRRACEAWPCRVQSLPGSAGGARQTSRWIRGAVRGSAVGISDTPWEVLRRRAFAAPAGAGAGSKAPCLPDATGEAGRLSVAGKHLFDSSGLGRGTAQSAWGPPGHGAAGQANATPGAVRFEAPRGAPAAAQDGG